jgi:hypothetical protein
MGERWNEWVTVLRLFSNGEFRNGDFRDGGSVAAGSYRGGWFWVDISNRSVMEMETVNRGWEGDVSECWIYSRGYADRGCFAVQAVRQVVLGHGASKLTLCCVGSSEEIPWVGLKGPSVASVDEPEKTEDVLCEEYSNGPKLFSDICGFLGEECSNGPRDGCAVASEGSSPEIRSLDS